MPPNCKYQDCKERAAYGFIFQTPLYCTKHGPIMKAYPQYRICMCGSYRPTYGYEVDLRPSACKQCIKSGMINKVSKRCEESGCKKVSPVFDYPNGKGKYCFEHRKDGMIDIKIKICNTDNCKKSVGYDYPGGTGQCCAEHKKDGMIDIKHPKCKESGCNIINPLFNYPNQKGEYCNQHKKNGMLNVRNKTCKETNCTIRPAYGFPNSSPEYCSKHRKNGMILRNVILCKENGCVKQSSYGYKGGKPEYCITHSKDNMENVVIKKCPGAPGLQGPNGYCPIEKVGNPKYNYYCCECFSRAFPNDPRSHLIHKKSEEILIRDFVNTNFRECNFIHDKALWINGCDCSHKRRIDLRTLINDTILAIEVDENQHKDRDKNDEKMRYDDLFMIHSGKWIFIRYNPHLYINKDGKRVNPHKEKRLRLLRDQIINHIERIKESKNSELVEIHNLFYDGSE
jgi:hypothetical protein